MTALTLELVSLFAGTGSTGSGILILFGLVPILLGLIAVYFLPKLVDRKVQRRSPKTFWDIEPRDKEIELTKDEIDSIELRAPKTWSSGHVKIALRSGQMFKLKIYKQASGSASLALTMRITGLLGSFAAKPPSVRTIDMTIWRF